MHSVRRRATEAPSPPKPSSRRSKSRDSEGAPKKASPTRAEGVNGEPQRPKRAPPTDEPKPARSADHQAHIEALLAASWRACGKRHDAYAPRLTERGDERLKARGLGVAVFERGFEEEDEARVGRLAAGGDDGGVGFEVARV
jgi:hypothetical protein